MQTLELKAEIPVTLKGSVRLGTYPTMSHPGEPSTLKEFKVFIGKVDITNQLDSSVLYSLENEFIADQEART